MRTTIIVPTPVVEFDPFKPMVLPWTNNGKSARGRKKATVSRETIVQAKTAVSLLVQQIVAPVVIDPPIKKIEPPSVLIPLHQLKRLIGFDVVVEIKKMYERDFIKSHFQNVATPWNLVQEIFQKMNIGDGAILCMFNVEWVAYLVRVLKKDVNTIFFVDDGLDMKDETGKISSIKAQLVVDMLGVPKENIIHHSKIERMTMKFDYIVGNPPYDSLRALHQQFFAKAFGLLKNEGMIAFIQPANPYFNKKNTRKKRAELEMQDIIREHCIEVHFKNEDVFENAQLGSKLAITYASPKKEGSQIKVKYQNGITEITDLSGINQLTISGNLYKTIREKIDKFCEMNGNFYDANKNKNGVCAKLPKVRGHAGQDDFNTFIPVKSERTHYTFDNHDFGIPLVDVSHLDNFYDYLETDFARACLALVKMDINLTGGELRHVPMVDFSKKYSEDELFEMAGLNEAEREILIKLIPDYYGRRK